MPLNNATLAQQFHEGAAQEFIIKQLIGQLHTAMIVRVIAVHPSDDHAGLVDVLPMVKSVATEGTVIEPSPIYNAPFFRLQAGSSAVLIDPQPGDIGIAVFAERDITNAVATRDVAPPNTARQYSAGDCFYIGGLLGSAPNQFVEFLPNAGGINIVSPGAVNLTAGGNITVECPTLVLNCNVQFNGNVSSTPTTAGAVTFGAPVTAPDFVAPNARLNTHQHAVSGGSTTGNPHN